MEQAHAGPGSPCQDGGAQPQRGPAVSMTHPISGAPIGVPPMRIAVYRLMTRPRKRGSVMV